MDSTSEREYLIQLRQILTTRFSQEELRALCFDLGVDYDSLPGEGTFGKATQLVAHYERRNAVPALAKRCIELRPDVKEDLETGKDIALPQLVQARKMRAGLTVIIASVIVIGILVVALAQPYLAGRSSGVARTLTAPVTTPAVILPTRAATGAAPEQAVRDYYAAINNRQYQVSWSMLSDHFKNKCCTVDGQYDLRGYLKWWDSVAGVMVGDIRLIERNGGTAKVYAELSYRLKTGVLTPDPNPYIQLTFDATTGAWLFYDKGPSP